LTGYDIGERINQQMIYNFSDSFVALIFILFSINISKKTKREVEWLYLMVILFVLFDRNHTFENVCIFQVIHFGK